MKNYNPLEPPILFYEDNMSLRDYFAIKVMQGLITLDIETTKILSNPEGRNIMEWIASDSYKFADAMLKAREK